MSQGYSRTTKRMNSLMARRCSHRESGICDMLSHIATKYIFNNQLHLHLSKLHGKIVKTAIKEKRDSAAETELGLKAASKTAILINRFSARLKTSSKRS